MAERIHGEATVVTARSFGRSSQANDGDSYWWQDLASARFGKTTWDLVLDVRPPQEPQYRVVGIRTKQPNKLFGIRGFLDGAIGIAPGLVLPVTIDPVDASDVTVDWKAFEHQAGARLQMKAADDTDRSAKAADVFAATLRSDPARFEKNRSVVLDSARDLADGVRNGTHSLRDLEALLATNIAAGLITLEEADAFRRAALGEGGS
jgi:hypothetical protein